MQNLLKSMERGSKLLTGSSKQRLDKMFTKVIVQQDLPLQVCESDTMHDFFLEVSQGRYKGVSRGTVRAIVAEMAEEGKDQTKIFVETCVKGGTRLSLLKDSDGQVKNRSDLDQLLGMSTASMDFDVSSVEGEAQLHAYMQVQQVPNDTDPLMWWKQHQQEFPDLSRMARQYLAVPVTSASPERFFSRVGLVQTDLRGSLLDTTMIDLMWAKQAP